MKSTYFKEEYVAFFVAAKFFSLLHATEYNDAAQNRTKNLQHTNLKTFYKNIPLFVGSFFPSF